MPVYNEAVYLASAIETVLTQDYENLELIISDNNSTDDTPRICAEYAARDSRVRYKQNETNIGGIANFNKVFELARGEYFMWAAGHDLRHRSQLSRCVEVLERDPAVVLAYPQTVWIDAEGEELEAVHEYTDTRGLETEMISRLNVVLWRLVGGYPVYGVFRSRALRRTRVYTSVVSPDVNLLIELSTLGTFAHVHEPLFFLRRTGDHGDWDVYVRKHLGKNSSRWRAYSLYWRMIHDLCSRVTSHFSSLPGKALATVPVLTCMLIKYKWILEGLREAGQSSPQPQAAQSEPAQGRRSAERASTPHVPTEL